MAYTNLTLVERIVKSKEYIDNVRSNQELLTLMAARSYTVEKLNEGYSYAVMAEERTAVQIREKGDQLAATDAAYANWNSLVQDFTDLRLVGRVTFKADREKLKTMNLNKSRERPRAKLESQIRSTVANLLAEPEMIQELTPYGFDQLFLEGMLEKLDSQTGLKVSQDKETSEALKATIVRDEAMAELDEWMVDFQSIARIALRNHPHLHDLVGIQS